MQIRQDRAVKLEEYACFCKFGKIDPSELDVLDVFQTPAFNPEIVNNYEALLIGGASEASVLQPQLFPFVKNSIDAIKICLAQNIPTFASCFGFQLAVVALGGEILKSETDFEMGTYSIQLTDEAKADLLFNDTPNGFWAISVHQEKAIGLPKNCVKLAYTDNCVHAFKVLNKPFWAFQFHPEVDKAVLEHRLGIYRDQYTDDLDHYENIVKSCRPTPESNMLVEKFVSRVLK